MGDNNVSFIWIRVGPAALVSIIYHCLAKAFCQPHHDSQGQGAVQAQYQQHSLSHQMIDIVSLENSTAQIIPAHKYQKGMVDDDEMCAVCLCEFEEGEELTTLPECLHSYHTPCIDMWLYSHSSCPMCRTDAIPSSQIFHYPSNSGSVQLDSGMLHNIVPSRTM